MTAAEIRRANIADVEAMGLTVEDVEQITRKGWAIYNAPRPIPCVWQDENGDYQAGLQWQIEYFRGWFFVAADPDGDVNGRTIDERMHDNDARRIVFSTQDECVAEIRYHFERHGIDWDEIEEGDMALFAESAGIPYRRPQKTER